tara:strand:+ start:2353 stop:2568 length:216 start_codon:yes stop_codon:yes gene_type:complete
MFTGEVHSMELPITLQQLEGWERGTKNIQDVFPSLTADQREFIKTGVTKEEWDNAFGNMDRTEEDYEDEAS